MGWGRTLLLGNIGNQMNIDDCEREIEALAGRVRANASQETKIRALYAQHAELALYLAALVRLLVAKGVFTREEFARLVDVIDAEDGAKDGGFGGKVV